MYQIKCDDNILYDPRIDETEVTCKNPKNLIRFPYTCFKNANTFEKNGLTFTQLDDGGIKIQGTVTEGIDFFAVNLDSMVLGADLNIYTAWGAHSKNGYTVSYNNGIVDLDKQPKGERIMIAYTGGNKLVWLRCYGNQTYDYVVYPMLNKGTNVEPFWIQKTVPLTLLNPKCKLEANTVGEGSFTILSNHPHYDKLKKLKSIFEIQQNNQVIFRGRMTNDSRDFHNKLLVDLEGVLAFTNDTVIAPFNFPEDCPDATLSTNIVQYFLQWILDQHNEQSDDWKQLKLGNVTVSDPNNYITRSNDKYTTTWEILKTKLFDSGLGGYLVIRYEDDGNYVDYVSEFEYTNTQPVTFGKNLLDITNASDATETYSAILPLGAETEAEDGTKSILTLESLEDGELTDDLVKMGKFIYSKSAKEEYGWICVPPDKATWDDVTDVENLKTKAMEHLTGTAMLFSGTITIKALDLSFTDEEIESFRVYRNVLVNSPVHGVSNVSYPLTKLEIDILNPQNTTITIGTAVRTLVDINAKQQVNGQTQTGTVKYEVQETKTDLAELKNQMVAQTTEIISSCNEIILAALESYVETSNFEEYKETVSTQLDIMANEILMNFTTATERIANVDGDLQAKFTQLYKFISFSGETAITIGSGDSSITLELDNEKGIVFKKNGLQFGLWDGENFYTGNIVVQVNERAQFGNFAFVPRSDGSLMFLKVGG